MKEATGEVSMTMVTIVAVAVIGGILAVLWPQITNWINDAFNGNKNCPVGYVRDANNQCIKQG